MNTTYNAPAHVLPDGETGVGGSGISWGAIIGGAFVAAATSLILIALGSGFGLSMMSPWTPSNETLASITIKTAIWMIIMQWVASALGGYVAGRLRRRWHNVQADEVFFRDTAQGFTTWAVATVLTAAILTGAAASMVAGTTQAVATVHAGAANSSQADPLSYYVDGLFRTERNSVVSDEALRGETTRLLTHDMKKGTVGDKDKEYLSRIVANRTGLSQAEATKRVDETIVEIKADADAVRKAGAAFSLFTAISLLLGAFIASVAAVIGGRHRDQ